MGAVSVSDASVLLVFALAACFAAGMLFERFRVNLRREKWRRTKGWRARPRTTGPNWSPTDRRKKHVIEGPNVPDAADQLRIVLASGFSTRALLNKSEVRVFEELSRILPDCHPGWRVMAQVSLGEVLRSDSEEAYRCINSKRIDLLLVDERCWPRHAIEYQGGAHHQGSAAARDAVKKEALRRAGVGYHEVIAGQTTPSELRRLVEKLVERPHRPSSATYAP